jgi:replicative DNA helicase
MSEQSDPVTLIGGPLDRRCELFAPNQDDRIFMTDAGVACYRREGRGTEAQYVPSEAVTNDDYHPPYLTGTGLSDLLTRGLVQGFGHESFDMSHLNAVPGWPSPVTVGRGLVTLIGGQPGQGKSALAEQIVFDLLTRETDLRVLIANVELSPPVLLARHIARLQQVDVIKMLTGNVSKAEREAASAAVADMLPHLHRLAVLPTPRTMIDIAAAAYEFEADVLLVDYVQRVQADAEADARNNSSAVMASLRACADGNRAVIAISALARGKSSSGSTYSNATGIASFRESSELEYGADWAGILHADGHDLFLTVVKNRYGNLAKIDAEFNGSRLSWQFGAQR